LCRSTAIGGLLHHYDISAANPNALQDELEGQAMPREAMAWLQLGAVALARHRSTGLAADGRMEPCICSIPSVERGEQGCGTARSEAEQTECWVKAGLGNSPWALAPTARRAAARVSLENMVVV